MLDKYRSMTDLDSDFFKTFWLLCDPYDVTRSKGFEDSYMQYMNILLDNPDVWM